MSQITGFDITIPKSEFDSHNELGLALKEWAKSYCFQLEKGEKTGYEHWQCRVRLIKKKRLTEVIEQIAPSIKGHWSATCKTVHKSNSFNYVMKGDTRVEGPWSDKDFAVEKKLTRQLKTFLQYELRPWQKTIMDAIMIPDDRKIMFVYDTVGNSGKSIFAEFLEYKGCAMELPPLRAFEDLMQFAAGMPDQSCYLIDMPRALKKDKLSEFYSGVECLKNGILWDKRYSAQKRRQDRPNIVVFANELPAFEYMSQDRWGVYYMTENYKLVDNTDLHIR